MMCKYCENGESIYYDEHGKDIINEVVIEDDNSLTISIQGNIEYGEPGYGIVIPIDYCPMCGRKLKEEGGKMKINEVLKEENVGKYYKSTLNDNILYQVVRYGDDLNLHSENDGYIDDKFCVYAIINAEFEEKKIIKIESELDKFMYKYIKAYEGTPITKASQADLYSECLDCIYDKYKCDFREEDVEIEVID